MNDDVPPHSGSRWEPAGGQFPRGEALHHRPDFGNRTPPSGPPGPGDDGGSSGDGSA